MISPARLLESIEFEQSRRAAEASLAEFIKQAWPIVEPGVEYVHGWHIEVIAEHLEAVTAGEIKRLLVNIPPRCAKSTIISVMWPCWEWITNPSEKYLCASYSGILSIRDNLKARRLIQSTWYQERWGNLVKLTGDQNAKTRFENTSTGYRIATSVGGTATGDGGSRLIIDDPHSALEAQSDAIRETAIEWFSQTMSTRLNTPKRDAIVVVMQRLHEVDVSGYIQKQGGYEQVILPMEFDGKRRKTVLGSYDPRTELNDLLWPTRFGDPEVAFLKRELGEYGAAGQLQQLPSPAGGGILKTKHIQLWSAKKQLPDLFHVLQSYDTAFTEKTTGDPSACVVFGVFEHGGQRCALIVDCWAEQIGYPKLRKKVLSDWKAIYGGVKDDRMHPGRRPDEIMIETKASGQSLLQDLRAANIPAFGYNPGNADKIARAHQAAPVLELDVIYVLESRKEPGQAVTWARPLISQLQRFPNDEHDDLTDAFCQAVIRLRDQDFFEMDYVEEEQEETHDYHADKRKGNPYNV